MANTAALRATTAAQTAAPASKKVQLLCQSIVIQLYHYSLFCILMFIWCLRRVRGYSSMQRWHFGVPRWYHLLWNNRRQMDMLSTTKGTKCYSIPWVRSWMTKKSNYGFACPLTSSYRDFMVFYPCEQAVCCGDKIHCCSEGTTCDVENSKCIDSSTKKEMPMWAKLPARVRAAWENQKGLKFLLTVFLWMLSSLPCSHSSICVCVCVFSSWSLCFSVPRSASWGSE